MFNNANVLFKTKFVDGVSTVTRYAQNQALRDTASANIALGGSGKSTVKKTKDRSKRARVEATPQPLSSK